MNLILQGPALEQAHVDEAARMTRASSAERIAPRAYRLTSASQEKSLPAWCEAREIDHAFMPEGRRFADLKLLAMDMDSTLITIESIDELGELAGKKREIAAISAFLPASSPSSSMHSIVISVESMSMASSFRSAKRRPSGTQP